MLYNSTRETLLQQGSGYTAMIADALFLCQFAPLTPFTAQQAIDATRTLGLSPKIVRAGLQHDIFSRRGRRNQVFTMPDANHARKVVGASVLKIRDNLPTTAFKSLKNYRQAMHHALIVRRPGRYTRGLLSNRLGVCKQTTRNYDIALRHLVTPEHVTRPLMPSDLDNMPTVKVPGIRKRKFLAKIDQDGMLVKHAPLLKAIAVQWLKTGFKVEIWEQVSNRYQQSISDIYTTGDFSQFVNS